MTQPQTNTTTFAGPHCRSMPDDQCRTLHRASLGGGNIIHYMGYMESGLLGSLELIVIEDEIVSMLKADSTPLEFSEENLARVST